MTFANQVIDTHVNKGFKAIMRRVMREFMRSEMYKYTAGGNFQKASYTQIMEWVIEAVKQMQTEEHKQMLRNAFKQTGYDYGFDGDDEHLSSVLKDIITGNYQQGYHQLPPPEVAAAHNLNIAEMNEPPALDDWNLLTDDEEEEEEGDPQTEILSDSEDM
jgi:hypothetical protein